MSNFIGRRLDELIAEYVAHATTSLAELRRIRHFGDFGACFNTLVIHANQTTEFIGHIAGLCNEARMNFYPHPYGMSVAYVR
jgi:hypothetical protein